MTDRRNQNREKDGSVTLGPEPAPADPLGRRVSTSWSMEGRVCWCYWWRPAERRAHLRSGSAALCAVKQPVRPTVVVWGGRRQHVQRAPHMLSSASQGRLHISNAYIGTNSQQGCRRVGWFSGQNTEEAREMARTRFRVTAPLRMSFVIFIPSVPQLSVQKWE